MRRRGLIVAIATLALLLLVARGAATLYTDRLWFQALGFDDVWRARAAATAWLTMGSAVVAFCFAFANLLAVRHSVVSLIVPRRVGNLEFREEVPGGRLVVVAALLAALLSAALTIPGDRWADALIATGGVPFGESDPYFQYDLGFFVYWLPFEEVLLAWTSIVVAVVSLAVVVLYALTPSLRWTRQGLRVTAYVRRHLTILGGVVLLLLAWSYRLDMYRLLADGHGLGGAFTAIDHAVRVPGSLILASTTLGGGLVVIWSGWSGQTRLAFFAVTVVLLLALGVRQVAPVVADWMAIGGGVRERPYADTRAGYTRRAYAVDQVRLFAGAPRFADLAAASRGVSVWDDAPLAARGPGSATRVIWRAAGQGLEALLVHGTSPEGAATALLADPTDPQPVIGEPRELAEPAVSDSAEGYGVVPDTSGLAAVIPVRSPIRRIAIALTLRDPRMLLGEVPGRNPGVVPVRRVSAIVARIAPFFAQGEPAPAVEGDSLRWIVPLYAASATYPLSARVALGDARVGYLQRAGIAVVDASTGRTRFFADSAASPLTTSWRRRFPRLMAPWTAVPAGLHGVLGVPREWAVAQVTAFAQVGARGGVGGNLHLPALSGSDSALSPTATPPMAIDGSLTLAWPLLDASDRVAGLAIVRGGAVPATWWIAAPPGTAPWGRILESLRAPLPERSPVSRPASAARGSVRAVPLADEVAFVQPMFGGGAADGLREVRIALRDTLRLGASLRQLAGQSGAAPVRDFRSTIERLYDAMRRALRAGDWTRFGAALDSIGRALGEAPR
ncbi:MAG: UPF0182 family protein [Gemmatimonadaceae bacterium]